MTVGITGVPQQVGPGAAGCPVRDVIDRVGDKWSVLLVAQLEEQPRRFSALLRGTDGLSQRMLTRTLRLLERDGLVARSVAATTPPQVTYSLTSLGHSLAEALNPLTRWALDNRTAVESAREDWDARSGARPEPLPVAPQNASVLVERSRHLPSTDSASRGAATSSF